MEGTSLPFCLWSLDLCKLTILLFLCTFIDKNLKRKIDAAFQDKNEIVKVILEFDDKIYKDISLDFAPEIKDFEKPYTFPCIKNFINSTSKANLSKYHGKIKMNICAKCQK